MTDEENATAEAPPSQNGGTPKEKTVESKPVAIRKVDKSPPKKPLPTNRIAFARQLEILRAFAAASGDTQKAVGLSEVSNLTKIASDTLSLANRFFLPVGFVSKADAKFTPSEAVREFALSFNWKHENAPHKLAPQLATGWFWEVLEPFLKMGTMTEGEVINKLALASEAAPQYQPQIMVLLNYLDTCGLIQREGTTIRMGAAAGLMPKETPAARGDASASEAPSKTGTDMDSSQPQAQRGQQPGLSTVFSQEAEGALRIMISVNLSMSELRDWRPDRITALFGGVAQVLNAKADVEREGADEA